MSLRLIKPGLSAAFPMRHPHTGEVLVPLGYTKRGKAIWPIMGAAEDDGTGGNEGSEGDDKDTGTGEDTGGQTDDVEGLKARIKALEEEKDRHYGKRTTAEKELEELRKFKNDLENASKSDLEKAQGEVTRLTNDLEKALSKNKELTLNNAFLSNNKISWHNPDEALRLADLSAVEVGGDGTVDVKALEAALTNLANKSKHLVKADGAGGAGDDDSENSGQGSGSQMNGKRKGEKDSKPATREELAKRFPVLNSLR